MEPRRITDRDADDDRNETAVDVDRALAALHGEETRPERARPQPRRQSRPARPRRTTRSSP
jgi:hypothetical protein